MMIHGIIYHVYNLIFIVTAKDFIRRLLQIDPSRRLTADLAIQHPFLSGLSYHNFLKSNMKNLPTTKNDTWVSVYFLLYLEANE